METYFGKPEENNLSDDLGEAVMRSVIRNIRVLLTDPENYDARSELAWASAMAENGILKIGKVTDFQCHMIEHQLGAYTNCNHGAGLAVIHPVLYRHICKSGIARFARWAQNVWGIAPKGSDEETALCRDQRIDQLHQGDRSTHDLCRTGHSCRHGLPGHCRFHQYHCGLLQKADPR